FNAVRVHTDAQADESARAVGALAYTVGNHIVFAAGRYAPATSNGRRLLAHELTHVVQQSGGDSGAAPVPEALDIDSTTSPAEREAESTATGVMRRLPVHVREEGQSLQRYGHAHSCNREHLEKFVWPGHAQALASAQTAIDATSGSPSVGAATHLRTFFGPSGTSPSVLAQINANFTSLRKTLDENYRYHCSSRGQNTPEALKCKGQKASTDTGGTRRDITLCFDQLTNPDWTPHQAAWLIIHENVHRLHGAGHGWEAGSPARCLSAPPLNAPDLKNPDAYACFAFLMSLPAPTP
ncbi:MAG: DUF4157 domain-containing protein, partial [Pseudonocardiaceae bacterium]